MNTSTLLDAATVDETNASYPESLIVLVAFGSQMTMIGKLFKNTNCRKSEKRGLRPLAFHCSIVARLTASRKDLELEARMLVKQCLRRDAARW